MGLLVRLGWIGYAEGSWWSTMSVYSASWRRNNDICLLMTEKWAFIVQSINRGKIHCNWDNCSGCGIYCTVYVDNKKSTIRTSTVMMETYLFRLSK